MVELKFGEITESIIGAAFKVHNTLGCGFQEVIYQRALELELRHIPIDYVSEFEIPIIYLDQQIGTRRVDFFVENKISVELKALTRLEDVHLAQAINYLEAYNLEIGLLLNFGSKRLEFHRFTNKKYNPNILHHPNPSHKSQTSQF
jgi:GxxExxY protein